MTRLFALWTHSFGWAIECRECYLRQFFGSAELVIAWKAQHQCARRAA